MLTMSLSLDTRAARKKIGAGIKTERVLPDDGKRAQQKENGGNGNGNQQGDRDRQSGS
jgi:hypothetical protein